MYLRLIRFTDSGLDAQVAVLAGVHRPVANFMGFGLPRLRPTFRRTTLRPLDSQLPRFFHPPHSILAVARQRHFSLLLPQTQQILGERLQVSFIKLILIM